MLPRGLSTLSLVIAAAGLPSSGMADEAVPSVERDDEAVEGAAGGCADEDDAGGRLNRPRSSRDCCKLKSGMSNSMLSDCEC